jgi:hypothetical protein
VYTAPTQPLPDPDPVAKKVFPSGSMARPLNALGSDTGSQLRPLSAVRYALGPPVAGPPNSPLSGTATPPALGPSPLSASRYP